MFIWSEGGCMLILLKESVVTACWLSLQGIAGRFRLEGYEAGIIPRDSSLWHVQTQVY